MIRFVLMLLMAQVSTVEVRTSSDETFPAQLMALSTTNVDLARDGVRLAEPVEQISQILLPGVTSLNSSDRDVVLKLIDGTSLACMSFTTDGSATNIRIASDWSVQLPTKVISSIQMVPLVGNASEKWLEICQRRLSSDVLVLRRGENEIESVEGIIGSVNEESVKFDFGGQSIDVPKAKIAGLRTYTSREPVAAAENLVILDTAGNRWLAIRVEKALEEAFLRVSLLCGSELQLPLSRIAMIDFDSGRSVYLADLEFVQRQVDPGETLRLSILGSEQVFGPRAVEYRLPDSRRTVASVQFTGGGTAVYRVPAGFNRLVGKVHLAADGPRYTSCNVAIAIENQRVWEEKLDEPWNSMDLEIEIRPDQRLKLIVEPISPVPVGDSVIWEGIRLLK